MARFNWRFKFPDFESDSSDTGGSDAAAAATKSTRKPKKKDASGGAGGDRRKPGAKTSHRPSTSRRRPAAPSKSEKQTARRSKKHDECVSETSDSTSCSRPCDTSSGESSSSCSRIVAPTTDTCSASKSSSSCSRSIAPTTDICSASKSSCAKSSSSTSLGSKSPTSELLKTLFDVSKICSDTAASTTTTEENRGSSTSSATQPSASSASTEKSSRSPSPKRKRSPARRRLRRRPSPPTPSCSPSSSCSTVEETVVLDSSSCSPSCSPLPPPPPRRRHHRRRRPECVVVKCQPTVCAPPARPRRGGCNPTIISVPPCPGCPPLPPPPCTPPTPIRSVPFVADLPGAYCLTADLTVPAGSTGIDVTSIDVTLLGDGYALVLEPGATGVVVNAGAEHVVIDHLTVRALGPNNGTGIVLLGADVTLKDTVLNEVTLGLVLSGATNVRLLGTQISKLADAGDTSSVGVTFAGSVVNVIVHDLQIAGYNVGMSAPPNSTRVAQLSATDVEIASNLFATSGRTVLSAGVQFLSPRNEFIVFERLLIVGYASGLVANFVTDATWRDVSLSGGGISPTGPNPTIGLLVGHARNLTIENLSTSLFPNAVQLDDIDNAVASNVKLVGLAVPGADPALAPPGTGLLLIEGLNVRLSDVEVQAFTLGAAGITAKFQQQANLTVQRLFADGPVVFLNVISSAVEDFTSLVPDPTNSVDFLTVSTALATTFRRLNLTNNAASPEFDGITILSSTGVVVEDAEVLINPTLTSPELHAAVLIGTSGTGITSDIVLRRVAVVPGATAGTTKLGAAGFGLLVFATAAAVTANVQVDHCSFSGAQSNNVLLGAPYLPTPPTAPVEGIRISDTDLVASGSSNMLVLNANDVLVQRCNIYDAGLFGPLPGASHGIDDRTIPSVAASTLQPGPNAYLANVVHNNSGDGIRLDVDTDLAIVRSNTLYANGGFGVNNLGAISSFVADNSAANNLGGNYSLNVPAVVPQGCAAVAGQNVEPPGPCG